MPENLKIERQKIHSLPTKCLPSAGRHASKRVAQCDMCQHMHMSRVHFQPGGTRKAFQKHESLRPALKDDEWLGKRGRRGLSQVGKSSLCKDTEVRETVSCLRNSEWFPRLGHGGGDIWEKWQNELQTQLPPLISPLRCPTGISQIELANFPKKSPLQSFPFHKWYHIYLPSCSILLFFSLLTSYLSVNSVDSNPKHSSNLPTSLHCYSSHSSPCHFF